MTRGWFAPNARVAVVAPCGPYPEQRFAEGVALATKAGLTLDIPPGILQPYRYLAAPDAVRLAQLQAALDSSTHDAVWIARGGYGLTRLLPHLRTEQCRPKAVVGFSDATALLAWLWRLKWPDLIHGPVVNSLPITSDEARIDLFHQLNHARDRQFDVRPLASSHAEGRLLAANLTLLASLCGTPWQVDVDGAILLVEDVGEAPYRIDRLLTQLVQAGALNGVRALLFGEFAQCEPPTGSSWTLHDVMTEFSERTGIPTWFGAPIGHGARNFPIRWGSMGRLDDRTLHIQEKSPGTVT
jgi:muramoyltetrapeptide carboxypeptidase